MTMQSGWYNKLRVGIGVINILDFKHGCIPHLTNYAATTTQPKFKSNVANVFWKIIITLQM